jgi:Rrf2 family protein
MDIALHQGKGTVTLNDIAKRQAISVKYLWQVINPLKTAGLLRVTRGAKGGYVLARRPEEITLYEIVTILEGELSLVDCLGKEVKCDMIDSCIARTVWRDVNQVVEKALKGITLAGILKRYEASSDAANYVI